MTALPLQRDPILRHAVELGASDVLLTAGHPHYRTAPLEIARARA